MPTVRFDPDSPTLEVVDEPSGSGRDIAGALEEDAAERGGMGVVQPEPALAQVDQGVRDTYSATENNGVVKLMRSACWSTARQLITDVSP